MLPALLAVLSPTTLQVAIMNMMITARHLTVHIWMVLSLHLHIFLIVIALTPDI
jgi:hypothetical protein